MTEREQHLENCLNEIADYCREHKKTCEGCIFYRQVTIDCVTMASCRIVYDPNLWDLKEENNDT